jgi:hypothetical protein
MTDSPFSLPPLKQPECDDDYYIRFWKNCLDTNQNLYDNLKGADKKAALHAHCCEQMTCRTKQKWLKDHGLPPCPEDQEEHPFPVFGDIRKSHQHKIINSLKHGVF